METENQNQESFVSTEKVKLDIKSRVLNCVIFKKIFSYKKVLVATSLFLFVTVSLVFALYYQGRHVPVRQFANAYSFVPEKISKSAEIKINLPAGIDEEVAKSGINFSPEIKGVWKTEELTNTIVFKPNEALRSGVYYAINMNAGGLQMSGDFFVDEDPEIQAIFPVANTESHEDSEITIVFNRPMVPLTTLDEQELKDLSITITPFTPGKFKWISTRNLQFVPETTLIPSSEYVVEIGEGLYSVDGLPVAPKSHAFITRPIRYEHVSSGQIGYRDPIIFQFNQSVNLNKTADKIIVKNKEGKRVDIDVEYGEVTFYDRELKEYVTTEDQTKLFVYQKKDKDGRKQLWDFETTYEVSISEAWPLVGTKELKQTKKSVVDVPDIIKNIKAESERSDLVRPDMFDAEGTLIVTFYDEVDKDRSRINSKGLSKIEYGTKCESEDGEISYGSKCIEVDDFSTLILHFNPESFVKNESVDLNFEKIIVKDGFVANTKTITKLFQTYPDLAILRTSPENQSSAGALDGIYVCSNTPLKEPTEGMSEYIKADNYIVYGRWSNSRYVSYESEYNQCAVGEFETFLRYGLLPETNYQLELSLVDEFGQNANRKINFKTETAKEKYVRFHNLQQQYNVTTPDRTKLTYAVENIEYVDMHICSLEPEVFLSLTVNQPEGYMAPSSASCKSVVSERIALEPKYWVNNYFQVDLAKYYSDPRGHYLVTLSHPLYVESWSGRQQYERTFVSVTNLAIQKKQVEYYSSDYSQSDNPENKDILKEEMEKANNLYWVNFSQSLLGVSGAVVDQYQGGYETSFIKTSSSVTDGQGIAKAPIAEKIVGAVVKFGNESAVITDWSDTLMGATYTRDASRTYVYTDRPIYRPTHTVNIKGIDRIGFDGAYEIAKSDEVKLEVFDPQGAKVYEVMLPQTEYGTFNTSYELPADAPLGDYQIVVYGQSFGFSVEEYVPAAFKLEVETNQEEFVSGDELRLSVQADYYFGVPVNDGTVSYSVTAQDYYFDKYEDEYFNFGRSWYYCYSCGYGDDFLFRGEEPINNNGLATIERKLDLNKLFTDSENEGSKLITVSLTAKDANGRSVSMQKSFIVHKGDFYLGSKFNEYYVGVNTPAKFRVKTVDVKGEPVSVSDIKKTLYKVNWETFKRQEVDGGFYYRSEKRLEEISSEKLTTDKNGDWSGDISFATGGQYEIQTEKSDGRGNVIKSTYTIYIYSSEYVSVPPNNNYELDMVADQRNLKVGDMASVLIKSPYPKAKMLITTERGTVYDYWIVDVVGGLYQHKFPITSEYAPNIFVSAVLLSPNPEVKFGTVEFEIDYAEKELNIEVVANKSHYLPGEEVTLDVTATDYQGKPVSAEISLAVADLSVLALKGNPKKNPALFFFDGFPLSVSTASNIRNVLYEVDIPLGTKGGDGANPDDLAKKKRGLFKDTAFWSADVLTDSTGKAKVSFTLPDNLTTWQIEGLGITKDTKLGVDYSEFTTKKDLMAIPLKPRFVVPGDKFSLGAKVFNQTDKGARIDVKITSDTLILSDTGEDSIFINAGEDKTIYFEVTAPTDIKAGVHTFDFTATGNGVVDSVTQEIVITPNLTYETVATANFTRDEVSTEYVYIPSVVEDGMGGLTINANATLAVFLSDAMSYMVTYPYGCSEQLASSLSTIGILTKALALPNIEGEVPMIEYEGVSYSPKSVVSSGLKRVYEAQSIDGGFSFYKNLKSDLTLTIHVATALLKLREAGYEINTAVLDRALSYVEERAISYDKNNKIENDELVIWAEYTLRLANNNQETKLTKTIKDLIKDEMFINEKISSLSLAYLTILTAEGFSRSESAKVYDVLKNRIDIDGRGAYLPVMKNSNYGYYETSIKNTALLVKAFTAREDEHPAMGNTLRWLLSSRDNRGVWGGTHNTFTVVDAMVDYLSWQKETESHFELTGLLGGTKIFGFEFSPNNVFEKFTHFIPIDKIEKEKLTPLTLEKVNKNDRPNNLYYDMALRYYLPVKNLASRDEGITVTRNIYRLTDKNENNPVDSAKVGEVVKGKLTITVPELYNHVTIEDFIPAGFEIVNFNLATEDQSLLEDREEDYYGEYGQTDSASWLGWTANLFGRDQMASVFRGYSLGGSYGNKTRRLYPTHLESHDDRVFIYKDKLTEGVYEYEYYLRALVPGQFQHLPAKAEQSFYPEVFGRTSGGVFEVTPTP